jgi:hypothetical protein
VGLITAFAFSRFDALEDCRAQGRGRSPHIFTRSNSNFAQYLGSQLCIEGECAGEGIALWH